MSDPLADQLKRFEAKMEAQNVGKCRKCGEEGTNLQTNGICPPCRWNRPAPKKAEVKQKPDPRNDRWIDND